MTVTFCVSVCVVVRCPRLSGVCSIFTQHAAGSKPVCHVPVRTGGMGRGV